MSSKLEHNVNLRGKERAILARHMQQSANDNTARHIWNNADLKLAHRYRLSLTTAPTQSNFRVVALVFFEMDNESSSSTSAPVASCFDDNGRRYLVGTNDEPCNMIGAICAERAALLQLRWIPTAKVTKVVIVTDAEHAVTPGIYCREFMASKPYMSNETPIVLGGCVCRRCHGNFKDVDLDDDCGGMPHDFLEKVTSIAALYPHQSLYTGLSLDECVALGSKWSEACMDAEDYLRKLARTAAEQDRQRYLHPISYGAAVYFRDKTYASAHQKKALEFGGTLDAVIQLVPILEAKRQSGIGVHSMVMCDQFGIAHPPFAGARTFLVEHGFGTVSILVHTAIKGKGGIGWTKVKAMDLVPCLPEVGELNRIP